MRTLIFSCVLFLSVACGSGENSNTPSKSESSTTPPNQGNSGGSSIIEMDTMHMDTSIQETTESKK